MNNFTQSYELVFSSLFYIAAAFAVIMIIIATITVINLISIKRLRRNYDSFMMTHNHEGISIFELLNEYIDETKNIAFNYDSVMRRTSALEKRITMCIQKVGVIRYNPFNDTGGDLSYVIALLDETNSGFVLNGIYNRSGSYTYAKEIENGVSVSHKLSSEEHQALEIAMKNESHFRKSNN